MRLLDLEITWLLWTKIIYHPSNIWEPNFGKSVYEALKMELIFKKKESSICVQFYNFNFWSHNKVWKNVQGRNIGALENGNL